MWVNGDKYVFSEDVVDKGIDLYTKFQQICQLIPIVKTLPELYNLKTSLEVFDEKFQLYEQAYISELIIIEHDARRFIYEMQENTNDLNLFLDSVRQLNSVTNVNGSGLGYFDP